MSRDIKFQYLWKRNDSMAASVYDMDEIEQGCAIAPMSNGRYWERVARRQFTGLIDKNGKQIFEGDIVSQHAEWNKTEYFDGGYSDSNSCETETIGVVKIYPSKGVVITRCKKLDIIACDGNWEKTWDCNVRSCRATVIGNIYENPELLSD